MVLYENYLICIFMNINENLKNGDKTIRLIGILRGIKTYIEPLGAFLIDTKWFIKATQTQSSSPRAFFPSSFRVTEED